MTIVADRKYLPRARPAFDGASAADGGMIGLQEGFALLQRRLPFILVTVIIGTLLSVFAAISLADVYTTSATLVLERRDAKLSEVDEEFEGTELNRAAVETEMDVITSREYAGQVVEKLGLLKDPVFNPFLPEEPQPWTVRTAASKSIDWVKQQIRDLLGGDAEAKKEDEPSASLQAQRTISTFLSRLKVYRSGESLAMSIEFTHPEPKRAAQLANAIVSSYVQRSLERKRASIVSATSVLRKRLSQLAGEIAEKERAIADHVRDNQLDIYRRDNRRDEQLRGEIARIKARLALAQGRLSDGSDAFSPAAVAELKADLAATEQELRNRTLADIRHRAMEQELETDRTRYNTLAERLVNLDSRVDLQNPSARVISKARVPLEPSFPKRKLIIGGGFVGSLGVAIIVALLLEALVTRIKSTEHAAQVSQLPNMAYVPQIPAKMLRGNKTPVDYLKEDPHSFYAESMRALFMACRSSNVERPPQALILTSALPGEGKSTVAVSLAVTTASLGHKTVLVDFDLHRCGATKAVGMESERGRIREYLVGRAKVDEIITSNTGIACLDVIAASTGPELPSSLLSSSQMRRLMKSLRSRYDFIVLDTPASLIVNDVGLLVPYSDAVLMVVRWGETREAELKDAMEKLRQNNASLIGTCINRVASKDHAKYGYGQARYQYSQAAG